MCGRRYWAAHCSRRSARPCRSSQVECCWPRCGSSRARSSNNHGAFRIANDGGADNCPSVQFVTFIPEKMIKDSALNSADIKGKTCKQKVPSYPCLRCGTCCSKYQALLSRAEAQQIADVLKIGWDEFIDIYTDPRWGGTESFLLRHQNGACIFLKHLENSRMTYCSINTFKPSDCKAWLPNPSKQECQEGQRNLSIQQ